MTGRLVLVATPIGNLGDLSPRAAETLAAADVVCCEDTRRTGRLLERAGVAAPRLVRVDDHTEVKVTSEVGRLLASGRTVAVVSDAGLPGISDPGSRLVRAAVAAGHDVSIVPGPSAAAAALVVSGLPTGRYVFEGFLPRRGAERARRLAEIAAEERTVIVYESPHRLHPTLVELAAACGPTRRAAVARELTKLHEEIRRGSLDELSEWARGPVKGEVVVVIAGAPRPDGPTDEALVAALRAAMASGSSRRDASGEVAEMYGVGRRRVYELALAEASPPGEAAP